MLETRVRTQATTDEGALADAAVAAQEYFDEHDNAIDDSLNVIVKNRQTGDEWEYEFYCWVNPLNKKERTPIEKGSMN